jgi:V/A-type H+-transporting ATPase subunit E
MEILMPLEKLLARIMRDAQEEYDRVVAQARAERDKMLVDAESQGKDLFRTRVAEARNVAEEEKRRRVTVAALDARKETLEVKQALIAEVLDRARDEVANLPEDRYVDFLAGMLIEAPLSDEAEVILSSRDREKIGQRLLERANAEREAAGAHGRLRLTDETRDIAGGFILRTPGLELNNSIEALIDAQRDGLEPLLVDMLFGGPDAVV